ncbi:MAG: sugar transferase [Bdellovibrionales bacterium CG10_big_fil_rev_8_21_14_0_10_45_34]|nr:MAG: sugar transferase [Bdellovibrionales bacterium CG10_big_fil_rev_8_21_14_0_10_45_34]
MKRLFDIFFSFFALILTSPLLLVALFAVYRHDRRSPFFLSERVGKNALPFKMIKIRTMVVGAHANQVDSTKKDDPRITRVGHLIRRFKVDELTQFLNVLMGDLSVVGPRPNVQREIKIYTHEEKKLLTIKPGVTDLSSVVFFDLANILEGYEDANIAYNQLVRPWKSRLGLLYVEHQNLFLDLKVIWLTVLSFVNRPLALRGVQSLVKKLGGSAELVAVSGRSAPLLPAKPPGATEVVTDRNVEMI